MRQFGDLALPLSLLLMLLLAAYLALYPAIFAVVMQRLLARFGRSALWLAPAAWVTTELGRAHLFTGFPWVLLGYSQATVLPVAQLASVFGVYGLSFLVALVNAALVMAAVSSTVDGRPLPLDRQMAASSYVGSGFSRIAWYVGSGFSRIAWYVGSGFSRIAWRRWLPLALSLVLVAVVALWGGARMRDNSLTREGTPIRLGLIQGNVAQEQKWDPSRAETILARYIEMSREAARRGARFIIWPESSLPYYFEEDPVHGDLVRRLAYDTHAYVLFGSDQIKPGQPPKYYNSAFMLTPAGTVAAVYQKIHLVPFGEYVPLKQLLFFAAPLVESVSDFSPGETMPMLPVGDHAVSTAICYEVVYPGLARQAVASGSQLLTTITNDAWYGRSSAPWQHFEQASLRAIEQGRYLARSANTGITGIVDPYGRVVRRSQLFEQTDVVGDARFLTGRTIYGRIGDVLAFGCAMLVVAGLIIGGRGRFRGMTNL